MRKPAFCEADQRLCFRYTASTIPLLPKYKISSLKPSSVSAQPGLCRTLSETPKTGFLTTRLILCSDVRSPDFKTSTPNENKEAYYRSSNDVYISLYGN